MAYASVRGRKPMERASKISHAEVINNPKVQAFLQACSVPRPADPATIESLVTSVPAPKNNRGTRAVIAIDGGFTEVPVREEFPAATLTFFSFGPLFLDLAHLSALDESTFIAPEDMARLRNIQRYSFVLPTRNISLNGKTLRRSVRETLQEFFLDQPTNEPPLMAAFRWLIFRDWAQNTASEWRIPNCPNEGCTAQELLLTKSSPDESSCPICGGPIYVIDALRLHERVDEEQGAGGILSYVITTLEQIALVHIVKALWEMHPPLLSEILFIKDGPLAFFGQTSPLSRPMRELVMFLRSQPSPSSSGTATISLLNAVGLEKSGAFVDHAIQIQDRLPPGSMLILSNEYIYRYVIPGDPDSPDPYGKNTYWGSKLIFKANDGNIYVATVPTGEFKPAPVYTDFPNLAEILSVISALKCSMYDNAIIPIALANKLVSLSDFPSARILESFARISVNK